ncbi:unnamed protein product [marine sediment metagenome]|uniref:Uncharacterized protein n=1 Tax=marine sediment metagenome TaxID=412755 RepID=X1MFK3_9ZZZZ
MLEKFYKYAIFLTAWGWAGFVVGQKRKNNRPTSKRRSKAETGGSI